MSLRFRERDGVRLAALVMAGASAAALAGLPSAMDSGVLRVCADPDNAPFSTRDGSGFENRIASLMADALGAELRSYWWPQRRGFVRNTLDAGVCDVVMGVPAHSEAVLTTPPYYRAGYMFAYRADRVSALTSYDDPRLRTLRIGVPLVGNDMAATPPGNALAHRGIADNVIGYVPLGTVPVGQRMIEALGEGTIDVALVWAPQAGYFAHREPFEVKLVPAIDTRAREAQAFDMAVGVRRGDTALRETLTRTLERIRPQIEAVLREYDVPVGDAQRVWASARTP
jgi:mxaJ protein